MHPLHRGGGARSALPEQGAAACLSLPLRFPRHGRFFVACVLARPQGHRVFAGRGLGRIPLGRRRKALQEQADVVDVLGRIEVVGTLVAEIVQGPIIPRVEHEGLVAIAALTGTKDQERMQAEQ